MMGRNSGQLSVAVVDMSDLIPENHLLRQVGSTVNFNFIYRIAKPYYSERGRPSIDPVCLIKMLLVGYLYGIRSERRLVEEVQLNIAYRWFCGFNMLDKIPDHSVFSQNRKRRFNQDDFFRDIFNEIITRCITDHLVAGQSVVCDGTFIPANVAWSSRTEVVKAVEQSSVKYLASLDAELASMPGYVAPTAEVVEKKLLKSKSDPDCGYINQKQKRGLGYLNEVTADCENGIIVGSTCYPANHRESDIILKHVADISESTRLKIQSLALDSGYDVGAVHRCFEYLGIRSYISPINFHNNALKKGFEYAEQIDAFICRKGKHLEFHRLAYKKTNHNYFRQYSLPRKSCEECEYLPHCSVDRGAIRINASSFYPAYHANRQRCKETDYFRMKRLRSIWSEGTFAALKNHHNLCRIQKRGMANASCECLLAALALNLKRIACSLALVSNSAG